MKTSSSKQTISISSDFIPSAELEELIKLELKKQDYNNLPIELKLVPAPSDIRDFDPNMLNLVVLGGLQAIGILVNILLSIYIKGRGQNEDKLIIKLKNGIEINLPIKISSTDKEKFINFLEDFSEIESVFLD